MFKIDDKVRIKHDLNVRVRVKPDLNVEELRDVYRAT